MFKKLKYMSPEVLITAKLTLLQFLFWAGWAFASYGTVYLQELGFPASSLGLLVSINCAVAFFSSIIFGILSDKINSVKKVFLMTATITIIIYPAISILPTGTEYMIPMFIVAYSAMNFFKAPAMGLLDNLTIRNCNEHGINYGLPRSTGSFSFAVMSLLAVPIVANFGTISTFYFFGGIGVIMLCVAFFANDPRFIPKNNKDKKEKISLKPLFKNYYYITFLIYAVIFYTATSGEFSFLTYYMKGIGIDPNNFGAFLAVRALSEIPTLFCINKLIKHFKVKHLIIVANLLMVLESLLLGFVATNLATMMICGSLFGIGNGIFIGSIATYVFRLAPDNLKASSHSIFIAVTSISGIIGNLIGGQLFEILGARNFYCTIGFTILTAVAIFIVSLNARKNIPNPAD